LAKPALVWQTDCVRFDGEGWGPVMNRYVSALLGAILSAGLILPSYAADLKIRAKLPPVCAKLRVDAEASQPMHPVSLPPNATCKPHVKNGLPLPDPDCSPGAINPTLTLAVLKTKGFTTRCVRDQASSPHEKQQTYVWYKIKKPANNSGQTQTCELDHIISLELGGADTVDNLWPQCGPTKAALNRRFFKQKDAVENFLAREVKAGRMDLSKAQRGIAEDWTQFLAKAKKAGVK
jgi:hypothetical protein